VKRRRTGAGCRGGAQCRKTKGEKKTAEERKGQLEEINTFLRNTNPQRHHPSEAYKVVDKRPPWKSHVATGL